MSETILNFISVDSSSEDTVAVLSLNRPDVANAFSAGMMDEIISHLQAINEKTGCRALVLRGVGKHFSAGADLGWMKESAKFDYESNVRDSTRLLGMFQALYMLRVPTVAAIQGAVYGGAIGLVAACDIAIAEKNAKFCMSEVKLGLLPAVIFPYLATKIHPGQLRRHSLTGRVFRAGEAHDFGLVEVVCENGELESTIKEEVNLLLKCSPVAQESVKRLHQRIIYDSFRQGTHTVEAIAKARTGESGQEGLSSFFEKRDANWNVNLDKDWNLDG